MANPNLLSPTTITGKTAVLAATTSAADLLVNASGSGKAMRVNLVRATNLTGTAATVTLALFSAATGGTATNLAKTVSVPANTYLDLATRDSGLWLMEDRRLSVTAGTGSAIEVVCSYEEVS